MFLLWKVIKSNKTGDIHQWTNLIFISSSRSTTQMILGSFNYELMVHQLDLSVPLFIRSSRISLSIIYQLTKESGHKGEVKGAWNKQFKQIGKRVLIDMYVIKQRTVTDDNSGCVQPLLRVCWETEDCKYESVSNLSHTDDRGSPTYTSHRTSGKHPRCLTAQMCSSAQPQPPTTAWPP